MTNGPQNLPRTGSPGAVRPILPVFAFGRFGHAQPVIRGNAIHMDRTKDRRSQALEHVIQRFEDRVRGIARRFDLSSSDLDELFQEVRIRLWKALDDPQRIDGVSGSYVYRTASSAAVDLIRRKRRGRTQVQLDTNLPDANPSDPLSQNEARETGEEISRALEGLDARRRPVVRMYLAGYGHKEIAALLGWSNGSTRNLLYRGLADLRGELSHRKEVWK